MDCYKAPKGCANPIQAPPAEDSLAKKSSGKLAQGQHFKVSDSGIPMGTAVVQGHGAPTEVVQVMAAASPLCFHHKATASYLPAPVLQLPIREMQRG